MKDRIIKAYIAGYEDSQCNHINDAEWYANVEEYLFDEKKSKKIIMKKYCLEIIVSAGSYPLHEIQLVASYYSISSSGYYAFYDEKDELIASYPIGRTIIYKIEDISVI